MGGILNNALDPLFMFVLLSQGQELTGVAIVTTLSNLVGCGYLLWAYVRATNEAPLSLPLRDARRLDKQNRRAGKLQKRGSGQSNLAKTIKTQNIT